MLLELVLKIVAGNISILGVNVIVDQVNGADCVVKPGTALKA